jgi:flavin-dependent dehydrogenase
MSNVDVLIVGAGPSGSTAATTLAHLGHSVAMVDKATFPRHKTCASWINALAFSRFPYLEGQFQNLVDCPFHGIRFYDQAISRQGEYKERKPFRVSDAPLQIRSWSGECRRRVRRHAAPGYTGYMH